MIPVKFTRNHGLSGIFRNRCNLKTNRCTSCINSNGCSPPLSALTPRTAIQGSETNTHRISCPRTPPYKYRRELTTSVGPDMPPMSGYTMSAQKRKYPEGCQSRRNPVVPAPGPYVP
ncbi:uncharacterized protein LOC134206790 [Armigeres subalbatus]|uniref:uncharacterized protein LOC134206790 n=1 Tax=Armigeres subalbatus TaxID=124917 RepID=UPI002ED22AA1